MAILHVIKNLDDAIEFQNTINEVSSWSVRNKLSINVGKTVFMQFGGASIQWNPVYYIDNESITEVNQFSYLSILWDNKSTFHVIQQSEKSIRLANASSRLSKFISKRSLNNTFYTM